MRTRSTNGAGTLGPPPHIQSLVLPLLLALFGIALVRSGLGVGHTSLCWRRRLLGALAWPLVFRWPAGVRSRKLPWIVFDALGLAALDALSALRWGGGNGRPVLAWLVACLESPLLPPHCQEAEPPDCFAL